MNGKPDSSARTQPADDRIVRLAGSAALTLVRRAKLLIEMRIVVPKVEQVYAQYWHFAEVTDGLNRKELSVLNRLLSYGPKPDAERPRGFEAAAAGPGAASGTYLLVVPRLGTISPWSSKATEIARRCGLAKVKRLERGLLWYVAKRDETPLSAVERESVVPLIHDRMTENVLPDFGQVSDLFREAVPTPLNVIDILGGGRATVERANAEYGFALSPDEIDYLIARFAELKRNPTDVELMMFAQANSEHCRHKIFNAEWIIDGKRQKHSLFEMIRHTHEQNPKGTLAAYRDNAAIIEGSRIGRFFPDPESHEYRFHEDETNIVMKVETHNHPTAISPHPGAATGSGGEIRDEGATGRGARPKAGITGFSVSNLFIPGGVQPWEADYGKPGHIASALQIMREGPVGGASFNNEFGRPNIGGYFRVFEQKIADEVRGYHKPIMLAGGLGNIRGIHGQKAAIPDGTDIFVIGGPAMLIGLGGGAASSLTSGTSNEALDFASVQRANAEMQRRCQEVIDQCWALGERSPILSIHDVGAGGLSNAVPELVHAAGRGGTFELRSIPNAQPGMSPMEIWCNEAQERYVLAIDRRHVEVFQKLCERERCPYALIGRATEQARVVIRDGHFDNHKKTSGRSNPRPLPPPVDMDLSILFGRPPRMRREAKRVKRRLAKFKTKKIEIKDAAYRVLRHPTVASKTFLVTIGDRSVGGLVCRDQMVGPWQVPVADVAVTVGGFDANVGEGMALGERTPLALIDPAASGRMAIGEALTNIAAARIQKLPDVKLSANWMAAANHPGEEAALFDTVRAVSLDFCPVLGISIPVGKDSLSMKTVWRDEKGEQRKVTAPLSLIVSAFAPVLDVRKTLTPQLRKDAGDTDLILIDLGRGKHRLGGSILAQVYQEFGREAPDVDDPRVLRLFFHVIQALNELGYAIAYHDRSDGGLLVTLFEMAFAGRTGLDIDISDLGRDPVATLFNEELGAVLQVPRARRDGILGALKKAGLIRHGHVIGTVTDDDIIAIKHRGRTVFLDSRVNLQRAWSETTYRMQGLRDNSQCAVEEFDSLLDADDPGLNAVLTFDPSEKVAAPYIGRGTRPRIAVLREQGVNGHVEMAAAFERVGFSAVDVTMSEILDGQVTLKGFRAFAAGGGFSFGDVLGAGEGWAKSILFNARAREEFSAFFARDDIFALGVCNGCQMMSNLRELIPGSERWPHFVRNTSEQFEARAVMVQVPQNPSILFQGMQGSMLPIAVAHGEGRAEFDAPEYEQAVILDKLVALCFVDNRGNLTQKYPYNPNGSPHGITGLTTPDGRITVMMPHPERVFRTVSNSWHPDEWGEDGPWLRMFRNARVWVG